MERGIGRLGAVVTLAAVLAGGSLALRLRAVEPGQPTARMAAQPAVDPEAGLPTAMKADDADCVLAMLRRGANPNFHNRGGDSLLVWAIEHCETALVRELLARGANPDAPGRGGATALHRAARQGNDEIVAL